MIIVFKNSFNCLTLNQTFQDSISKLTLCVFLYLHVACVCVCVCIADRTWSSSLSVTTTRIGR